MKWHHALSTAIGLGIGNFLFIAAFGGEYLQAADRTFFQCIAIGLCFYSYGVKS